MQADQQKPLIQVVDTYLAGGCHKFSEEVDLENIQAASCSPQLKVGYDTAGCKGKAVCISSSLLSTQIQQGDS